MWISPRMNKKIITAVKWITLTEMRVHLFFRTRFGDQTVYFDWNQGSIRHLEQTRKCSAARNQQDQRAACVTASFRISVAASVASAALLGWSTWSGRARVSCDLRSAARPMNVTNFAANICKFSFLFSFRKSGHLMALMVYFWLLLTPL